MSDPDLLVAVDVACNDPDNGLFAFRASALTVGGSDLLQLEAVRLPSPRFVEIDGGFRLAGKAWPIRYSRDWFGNWAWNRYWLEWGVAVSFVVWLRRRRLFSVDCAEAGLFEFWKTTTPITADELAHIERLLREDASR